MINLLDSQILAWISAWFLPFVRILGLISTAPILSSRSIANRTKLALAALLAMMVAPFLPPLDGLNIASPSAWAIMLREMVIGMAIGFLARLVLLIFEIAGELIGLQIGLSYAGYFSPGAGHGNAIGSFAGIIASWMFVILNGPLLLLACVIHSYEKLPVVAGQLTSIRLDPNRIFAMMSDIFAMSLVLALPVASDWQRCRTGRTGGRTPNFPAVSHWFWLTKAIGRSTQHRRDRARSCTNART